MNRDDDPCYVLAPGIEAVPLEGGRLLFRSETLALRVEGDAAGFLASKVLGSLDGRTPVSEVAARAGGVEVEVLRERLDALVRSGALRVRAMNVPREAGADVLNGLAGGEGEPLAAMAASVGVEESILRARLGAVRAVVFGASGPGGMVASMLARLGVGHLVVVDPGEVHRGDLAFDGWLEAGCVGQRRETAAVAAIGRAGARGSVRESGGAALTRESVAAALEADGGTNLVLGCFDRGMEGVHHWINRAAVKLGVAALYSEVEAHVARVGPLVAPGRSACYMCYRMRRVACEASLEEAMAYEQQLNRRLASSRHTRPALPMLASHVAGVMALEVVKQFALDIPSSLVGRMLETDGLTLRSVLHPVLMVPGCPVCSGKKAMGGDGRTGRWGEIGDAPGAARGDILATRERLVSARTGVVTRAERFEKDAAEPFLPLIVRADVANHRFVSGEGADSNVCSGKGLTIDEAMASALGEAVERYSGGVFDESAVVWARRGELDRESVDPRRLALYLPGQYAGLAYAPYDEAAERGWVAARSVVTGAEVMVPALAVYMNYRTRTPGEFLFPITSNGLATGPTLEDAVARAMMEVIERDAFMMTWYHRLRPIRRAAGTHPEVEVRRLCRAYRRRGVEVRVLELATDVACAVFAAVALQVEGEGPAAVVGLGADADPARAARKAVMEVAQVRPSLRKRMRQPEAVARLAELVADPRQVETLDDHDLLYAAPSSLGLMSFLLDAEESGEAWPSPVVRGARELVREVAACVGERCGDVLFVDLTPPDMRELGLYTARVIMPGMQPIDFGWKERRLAGERVVACPSGLAARRCDPAAGRNDAPHPLA